MKNTIPFNICLVIVSAILFLGASCGASNSDEKKVEKRETKEKDYVNSNQPKNVGNANLTNENMNKTAGNENIETVNSDKFHSVLEGVLQKRGLKKKDICDETDVVQSRILNDYGAIFLVADSVTPPPTCMFTGADDVTKFQEKAGIKSENINGAVVELQPNAMKALLEARDEAKAQGLDITPRDGAEAARRGFDDTLRLWKSRFDPACDYWKGKGKLTDDQINKLKSLPIKDQVKEVLELEKQGIYFNTSFTNSILYSVAAPGTSQHLSMLAFDADQFANPKVRKILGNHGWFRTVKNDSPHFTFLGAKEENLKNLGLKKIDTKDGEFWIPNI